MKIGGKTSILVTEALGAVCAIFTIVCNVGALICAVDQKINGENGITSPNARSIFLYGAVGGWGLFVVAILYLIVAAFKCQAQIQSDKQDRKTKEKFNRDIEKGLTLFESTTKRGKKQRKMAGTRNKLLNRIHLTLEKLLGQSKSNLKVFERIDRENKIENEKARNMNDLNFKIMIQQNESLPSKGNRKKTRHSHIL